MHLKIKALFSCLLLAGVLLMTECHAWAASAHARPAILFCSPDAVGAGFIDLEYLKELHEQDFEVDYTTGLDQVTWERLKNFNAIVVFGSPEDSGARPNAGPEGDAQRSAFKAVLERYLQAGGGVFLMTPEYNMRHRMFSPELQKRWGVQVLQENMVEKDTKNLAMMTHMPDYQLAYTDVVQKSPVSEGVRGIWYPVHIVYNARKTMPLQLGPEWQAVVKAPPTTTTERVSFASASLPLIDPWYAAAPMQGPPIFGIREYGKGRIAAISTWQQYSVGSGTKWLFNREVLEKGLGDRPSDFGRLLSNSFRWLAAPSLAGSTPEKLGGFTTAPRRLIAPNYLPEARADYEKMYWVTEPDVLGYGHPPRTGKIVRGLIGARTTYGGGASTVAEYAAAAKKLGLDFLVLLDEFDKLTPEKLQALKADCLKNSDDKLKLFPGYTIENNTGNRMFFFGSAVPMPPAYCLTGPNKTVLMQQLVGREYGNPVLNWILSICNTNNIGYYDFKRAEAMGGMRLSDCKVYSMGAVRTYRDGKLVEDITDEYLTTAQGTVPPSPSSFNEVRSVGELERELALNHSLTYGKTTTLDTVYNDVLRYHGPTDALNVFLSDGPRILEWPEAYRTHTPGGQEFVTARILMKSPLVVISETGLKEIRIYNGRNLFRRFVLKGAKNFNQTLLLNGAIYQNLVVVAEDIKGGTAVSSARRSWANGSGCFVTFCSDRVNDCKSPSNGPILMAHGPYSVTVTAMPQLSNVGETWDGGPAAAKPLASFGLSNPVLVSDRGTEDASRFNQTPLMEFTDEGAAAVTSVRDRVYGSEVVYANPWFAYGPSSPSQLMDYTGQIRVWALATVGTNDTGWMGPGIRVGVQPTLYRGTVTFKQNQKLDSLALLTSFDKIEDGTAVKLVLGEADSRQPLQTIDVSKTPGATSYPIGTGEWFGVCSDKNTNSHLFINRGEPFILNALNSRLNITAAIKGRDVKAGDSYKCELLSFSYPLDLAAHSSNELLDLKKYLDQPYGLKLLRGTRLTSAGILDLQGKDSVVDFQITRPPGLPKLTLPARVAGLNPNWTAGLWQKKGYEKGDYGNGLNRYTPLGIDSEGYAYLAVKAAWRDQTHLVAGHPVIADAAGKDLFIQVTRLSEAPSKWHLSVNNPTDIPVTAMLRRTMDLPGFKFKQRKVTLQAGEYLVLE